MRESDDAAPLITLVPWRWNAGCGGGGGSSLHLPWGASTSPGGGGARRELLWHASVLDSAAEEDGLLSLPCMRFVAHRHCQHTLDKFFAGDFPGSNARIPPAASLLAIAAQALLPFLPGTLVEVMPVAEGRNVALRGSAVEEEHRFQLGDGETDPDLIDAIKAVFSEEEKGKTNENSLRDILEVP